MYFPSCLSVIIYLARRVYIRNGIKNNLHKNFDAIKIKQSLLFQFTIHEINIDRMDNIKKPFSSSLNQTKSD